MKHITSRDNPFFKQLHQLAQSSRERRKSGLTLLDGAHLLEAYRSAMGLPEAVVVNQAGARSPEIQRLLATLAPLQAVEMSDALFKEIAPVVTPTGVIALIHTPRPEPVPQSVEFCLALAAIQDPGNLGSMLRSAAAAGVTDVLLSPGCAFAWSPRVIRAGMGAHFSLRIHEHADLETFFRNFSGKIVATALDAQRSLFDADLTGAVTVLIGNEGAGLSPDLLALASERVIIPMPGQAESLNAAAAAAVCLFERVRQTRA